MAERTVTGSQLNDKNKTQTAVTENYKQAHYSKIIYFPFRIRDVNRGRNP